MAEEVNAMGCTYRCRPSLPLQDIWSQDTVPLHDSWCRRWSAAQHSCGWKLLGSVMSTT